MFVLNLEQLYLVHLQRKVNNIAVVMIGIILFTWNVDDCIM